MFVESGSLALVDTYDEASMSWTEDIGVFLKIQCFKSVNTTYRYGMQIKYQCEKVEWKELIRREETIIFFELLNCFRRNVYSHSKLKPRLRNKGSLHSTFSLLIWTLISPLVQTDKSHLLSIIALGIFVKINCIVVSYLAECGDWGS